MNSTSCNMVRDLLPLYIDEVCCEESRCFIEEHLKKCEECRNYYEDMKWEIPEKLSSEEIKSVDENLVFLEDAKKSVEKLSMEFANKITRKRMLVLAIVVSIIFMLLGSHYLRNCYDKIPQENISVKEIYELDSGHLYIELVSEVPIVEVHLERDIWRDVSKKNQSMSVLCSTQLWRFWDDSLPKEVALVIPNTPPNAVTDIWGNVTYDDANKLYYHSGNRAQEPIWEYQKDAEYKDASEEIEKKVKDYVENVEEHVDDYAITIAPTIPLH